MKIDIKFDNTKSFHDFLRTMIFSHDNKFSCELNLDFKSLYKIFKIPSKEVLDFLFIASIIYATDKLIPRKEFQDNWTRNFDIEIPVSNPDIWTAVKNSFSEIISFLTGDDWNISFSYRKLSLYYPRQKHRKASQAQSLFKRDFVCLFSGGLDSLIGAINLLESNPDKNIHLVGHHDKYGGPKKDQSILFNTLKNYYNSRIALNQVFISQNPTGDETSFRSRSLLFIAIGIYAVNANSKNASLYMPENGAIALNIPLTPSRKGSCSTRTSHPYYLSSLNNLLSRVGIENKVVNTLQEYTKGETISNCSNQAVIRAIADKSFSCAKAQFRHANLNAQHCGKCVPCIYRQAAFHKNGLSSEKYKFDILTTSKYSQIPTDWLAVISFLKKNPSEDDIFKILLTNGKLDIQYHYLYSGIILRALDEIRTLINDKGSDFLKRIIKS